MNRYVILSVNQNQDYLYYLPITIWSWERIGWIPVVMFHGDYANEISLLATNEFKGLYINVPDIGCYRSDTITQISRLYAATHQMFSNEDLIMTADVDMLALSDYWHPKEKDITIYGEDLTDYTEYPICFISMTAGKWREIMCLGNEPIEKYIGRDLDLMPNASSGDFYKFWGVDQQLITKRIKECNTFDKQFIPRGKLPNGYASGRVDRGSWTLGLNQYIDCHMHRDLFKYFYPSPTTDYSKKWLQHTEMLRMLFKDEDWSWYYDYTKNYANLAYGK